MYQQLWGYKVEEKLYLGVGEQKRLNTTGLYHTSTNLFSKVALHSLTLVETDIGLDSIFRICCNFCTNFTFRPRF
jgi:hypothetical protein